MSDNAEDRMYRTLVRVVDVTETQDLVVSIPARPGGPVTIPHSVLPEGLVDVVVSEPSYHDCTVHIHVRANLNADEDADLKYEGPWEMSKSRIFTDQMHVNAQGNVTDYGVERLEDRTWQ